MNLRRDLCFATLVTVTNLMPHAAPAAEHGDPKIPAAGDVLGTVIHTQDAEELRYVVLKTLTDRYAQAKGITVMQAETAAYVAEVRRALSKDPAAAAMVGDDSAENRAARQQIAEAFILQWKINRALYAQYGGRIIYQQGGPEPLDAYRKFLEERQAAGDFKIASDALAAKFWHYYRDDSIHSFFKAGSREEALAFAAPPWEAQERSAPDYVRSLEGAYGLPSQKAFGSAVFFEVLRDTDDLAQAALAKYRYFVGPLWDRYGDQAWMSSWREVYAREPAGRAGIIAELRGITDRDAQRSVPMMVDNREGAEAARMALAAAFDDPAVRELRVFTTGDGGAMSGLLIAGRRSATGETTFVVFLMD